MWVHLKTMPGPTMRHPMTVVPEDVPQAGHRCVQTTKVR